MSDNSHIEWTDATLNFATGCTKVSEGCRNCYIDRTPPFRMAGRRFVHPAGRDSGDPGATTGVELHPERLDQLLRWQRPRMIFTPSLSDWLHDDVPDSLLAQLFAVIALTPRHTYQLTTKRPARGRSLLRSERFRRSVVGAILDRLGDGRLPAHLDPLELHERWWPLRNAWIGVSVEDQAAADLRIPILLDTPAAVRWISAEPLLGPVDVAKYLTRSDACPTCDGSGSLPVPGGAQQCPDCEYDHCSARPGGVDWVVAGGESGPDARPMHPDWARTLRDQCQTTDVPYLFKQWGEHGEVPKLRADGLYDMTMPGITVADDGTVYHPGELAYPDGPRYGEAIRAGHDRAHLTAMYRTGKKAAGRELDGRTWDEYPSPAGCGTAGCVGDCHACAAVLQAELAAHGLPQMTTGEPL